MYPGLRWRGAGASHRTWIIKTERMPLLFCRVSAQSVRKVETGDTVLKGAGTENKLVLQMKEVRCWDWAKIVGGGWESFEMGLESVGGSLEVLQQRTDILVWKVCGPLLQHHLVGLFLGGDTLCVRLCQIIVSEASLPLNAFMFTCLFTLTKLLRWRGGAFACKLM